jgi:hypothetical protein
MWLGKKFMPQKYHSDTNGFCEVALPEGITELNLTTRVDPYADTRLLWHPDRGDKIPPTYLLRLIPGVPIGGLVVDAENRPVPSAKVGFNHEESPSSETEIENHNFAWIETETDSEGKWRINRIAEEVLRRIYGSASEPEHVSAKMLFVTQEPLALQKLKMFNYTFQLGDAVTISGFVRDESGNAVPDAKVLVGSEGSSDARRAQVNLDGSFEVKGCKPGKNLVTAEAPRYAPTTIQVDLKPNQEPINIRLKAGKVLKLLVVNKQDEPIANAQVWLNTMDSRPIMANEIAAPFIQTEYSPKTDRDGRVFWDQAPDRELAFDIEAAGYMRIFGWKVKPDGQEHKVTLGNALKIQGTVVDAQTQAPIPRFKIITGWPESLANPVPRWSSIDRFWLTFNDGKFEHTFGEPPIVGTPEPAFMFKFEAEGYAPFISRVIKVDEGTVTLDVALTQAKAQVVTVLQPGGTPAAHADVAFGNQSEYIHVAENGFSRLTTPLKVTDAKGQFAWQADPTVEFIIIYHSNGFVVTSPTDLANNSSVQLSGWGRIEGQMTAHGKPKVGRVISYGFDQKSLPKLRVFFEIREKTDASGKFTFEKVPSGKITLSQKIPANPNEPSGAFTEAPLKVVDVKAGETTVFNYDEKGRIVALSLLWPENIHIDEDQQVFAAVTTPFTPPPAEIRNNPNALKIWREQPAVQEVIANMRSWQLIKSSANKWKSAIEIPPGTYQVNVSAVQKNSGPNANILQAMSELVIPDDMNESELEVGPIALQPIPQRLP